MAQLLRFYAGTAHALAQDMFRLSTVGDMLTLFVVNTVQRYREWRNRRYYDYIDRVFTGLD